MARDSLRIEVSATLREAVGFGEGDGGLDYFALLGVARDCNDAGLIDKALIERTKALRKWQNSPKFGAEVVKLLNQLHRAVKILKDPNRCALYREELARLERGETASAEDRFADLVRAAMADAQLDAESRQRLTEFAVREGISSAEAQRIATHVRAEMEQRRAADRQAQPAQEEGWQFRIAVEGEEGFQMMLAGMEASGEVTEEHLRNLLRDAPRYQLDALRAGKLIADFQARRFKRMVEHVAGGRAINDDQARLLVMKARAYGLDDVKAYEIISDYTLSAYSTEDGLSALELTQSFTQDDIAEIIEGRAAGPARRPLWSRLTSAVPAGVRNAVLGVIALGVVVLGVFYLKDVGLDGPPAADEEIVIIPPEEQPPAEPVVSPAETAGTEPAATPAPIATIEPTEPPRQLVSHPDPPSGMIRFDAEAPGDPPPFEMGVTEVTNELYNQYVRFTLDAAPASWPDGRYPADQARLPVTGVTWHQAMNFCRWFAALGQLAPDSVRLPTLAEYRRALRGDTLRGDPTQTGYWARARLYQAAAPKTIKATPWDRIYIPGSSQMYDLIGNVAEWGMDEQGANRVILGGDFTIGETEFDHLQPRWRDPDQAYPEVGFRLVHVIDATMPAP